MSVYWPIAIPYRCRACGAQEYPGALRVGGDFCERCLPEQFPTVGENPESRAWKRRAAKARAKLVAKHGSGGFLRG